MIEAWEWPQWTIIALYALTILIHAANDGKPKTGNYSFPLALCAAAIASFVLYMGGFFS